MKSYHGSGTPFEEGLNTIVIPTSLFTETVFNARVQNETLSETPIYSDDEDIINSSQLEGMAIPNKPAKKLTLLSFDLTFLRKMHLSRKLKKFSSYLSDLNISYTEKSTYY